MQRRDALQLRCKVFAAFTALIGRCAKRLQLSAEGKDDGVSYLRRVLRSITPKPIASSTAS
jgi:hypothetical protein